LADSPISATPPLVSTELGALAGDFPTGPTGILLIYPLQKSLIPNMLIPDLQQNNSALLNSD
jgi:hypothetical protein